MARSAANHLDDAAARAADSPWLAAIGTLPFVDEQLEELRSLTSTLSDVGERMEAVAGHIDHALEDADDGAGRIALLDVLDEQLEVVAGILDDAPRVEPSVPGPLGDARQELNGEFDQRAHELHVARRRVQAIRDLLAGPTRLLVLGGNNAETSGSVGMPLTVSVLDVEGGELALGDFVPTGALLPAGGLEPPGDLARLFPLHGVGFDFRGTTATANFPSIGPLLMAMSENAGLGPVDGVVLLDSFAVSALVGAVGSVEVDGRQLDGETVLRELVLGNYQRFSDYENRDQRYALQDRYAKAVFEQVTEGGVSPAALATALADAARTRHLLAYSPDTALQELYEATGAAGVVGPESLAVAVENMDGNKLDTFIRPHVAVDAVEQLDGGHRVTLTVEVEHPQIPPEADVEYVVGPTPEVHFVQTVVHIPDVATEVEVLEAPELRLGGQGRDGDSILLTGMYGIPSEASVRYTVRFRLPRSVGHLEVVPSTRPLGQRYTFGDLDTLDYAPFRLNFDGATRADISLAERGIVASAGLLQLIASAVVALAVASGSAAPQTRRPSPRFLRSIAAVALLLSACSVAVAA